MRNYQKITSLALLAALVLFTFSTALAAPAALAIPPCMTDPDTGKVSGTVVGVDDATVTVDTGGGALCTVNISVDEIHPVTLLLGMYFGDVSSSTLEGALASTQGCAVFDGTAWAWADCDAEGAVDVRVTGVNDDGTFIAHVIEDGSPIDSLSVTDPAILKRLNGALETLIVAWTLDGVGDLQQVSDKIADLHDQGMGFGVLVKLFAIASASEGGVTVDELVIQVQAGTSMGELFKAYGKPDKTGVGHVRQEMKDKDKGPDSELNPGNGAQPPGQEKLKDKPPKENKLKGICKALSKGGKPNKGGVTCP